MKGIGDLLRGITPPAFNHACPSCGTKSARPVRCLACEDTWRAAREAKTATAGSIPTRFAQATGLYAPEVTARVDRAALEHARLVDLRLLDRVTLLGPATAGKTTLAVALANAWVQARARPAMVLAAVDLGLARQQHGLGAGEARLVHLAMIAPLLVLDDVGQEVESGTPAVAHAIQHRYDHAKPTIATSGLTVAQLVARYGAGVARRLLETAGGAVVFKLRSRGERGMTG